MGVARNSVPAVRNAIPDEATITGPITGPIIGPIEHSVAARTLQDRTDSYAEEVRRLLDAAYAVMRHSGTLDPRVSDIVAEAGLSNQAFYRHFRGKDELLLAVLDEGQRRLVSYLETRLHRVEPGAPRVRAWIEGVLEQARNPEAVANTKPFTANSARLATEFPSESARSREQVIALLRVALVDAGGNPQHDADAIYHLAMGRAGDAIARGEVPTKADVGHIVEFALRGIGAK